MHKLKQLVHHCFEEFPMRSEETRVLAHDIHNVAGYDRLVVLASHNLHQPQQIFDDMHQKFLFIIFPHRPRY